MKNNRITPMNSDEIITVLRTENEKLQQQVSALEEKLAAVNSDEKVITSNKEYEQMQRQMDWLTVTVKYPFLFTVFYISLNFYLAKLNL